MTYRAVGSSTGQLEITGKDQGYVSFSDFGSGDMPFPKADYDALVAADVEIAGKIDLSRARFSADRQPGRA